jgi:hypothetical protein
VELRVDDGLLAGRNLYDEDGCHSGRALKGLARKNLAQ